MSVFLLIRGLRCHEKSCDSPTVSIRILLLRHDHPLGHGIHDEPTLSQHKGTITVMRISVLPLGQ